MIDIDRILEAEIRVKKIIQNTALSYAPYLSQISGGSIYLKKENLQNTGAYKIRGAFNKMTILLEKNRLERDKGVIAASAGNHAQGVAYSAKYYKIPCTIVMPEATPLTKVLGVKNYDAEVILVGNNYDEAYDYAIKLSRERGLSFIHPFADDDVIAGQGTIALEMIADEPELNTIIVPIGGGGLISGVASVYKQLKPNVKIVGVTSKGAPALFESFKCGKRVSSNSVKTIADGIAVRDPNPRNLEHILELVDDVVQVNDEEIASAILFLLERQKLVVEGAGATVAAAIMHNKLPISQKQKVGAILTGGNIDVTMLSLIIEKGLLKSYRKMKLKVTLIDKPGSLKAFSDVLSECGANIVKIDYDRVSTTLEYGDANVVVFIETKGQEHQEVIKDRLNSGGFRFLEFR